MADLPAPSIEAERNVLSVGAQSEPVSGDSLALPVDDFDTTAASESSSPTISRSASLINRSSRSKTRQGSLSGLATCPSLDFMQSELSLLEQNGASRDKSSRNRRMVLEMADGTAYEGIGFGAEGKSISGECVFQTGMVGYPESLTDPSYEGQILVLTYPLIGSYGVPDRQSLLNSEQLPAYFESSRIHIAALVVSSYSGEGNDFSHHLAKSELGTWLKEEGIPAICGVDTRALTKKLRQGGSLLAKVLARDQSESTIRGRAVASARKLLGAGPRSWANDYIDVPLEDPNTLNLVAQVSRKKAHLYRPKDLRDDIVPLLHPDGRPLRVIAVDVGMKYNQIRCFLMRGIELKCVPWDYDFTAASEEPFDGLFISNGPGDPTSVPETIKKIAIMIERASVPIFGICLGHQLLALAAGASTIKMKYGNRGQNIPCTDLISGRCYITSQNHGYAVDTSSLTGNWKELFVNANDGSNEGIYCTDKPYFSVQFHPESTPGPGDTEFLFDVFINNIVTFRKEGKLVPVLMPGGLAEENAAKHPRVHVKKVLILGSGGLSIGQAGEFDYSGSQAIKALKEEGIYTILINPNIATIQTSSGLADKVYFLPVTPDFVRKVIQHERPDGIYVTFGGQTALNVGIKLKDEFEGLGVRVLGTPIQTIITTEDRELFANAMSEIGEKCAQSASATTIEDSVKAAETIGYPVIVRAAFALGGLGSGFAQNTPELVELCTRAFATSPQVLIEKSMKGWKEIEYEVVRDCRNNCITVCNMENFDPLGIHTGDSIVVAPSQTLSDADYNMLRTTAVNVIRHLGVVGECNIQYALNPDSQEYCIIEVNARLSRSSALASKATGYPLAFIAAKLGLGVPLNEIRNSVTKKTSACFEPSLDYVVIKIPRWDLKKFQRVSTALSSSMKSVGEVMAIGRNFEETIQKAIRAIDPQFAGFGGNDYADDIDHELANPSDKRIFAIANAMKSGYSVDKIWQLTKIDKWFLNKLMHIIDLEGIVSRYNAGSIPSTLVSHAKQMGFSDKQLAALLHSNELAVRRVRQEYGIFPFTKQIDTVAAEFPCFTNYLYTTYNAAENDVDFEDHGVMVLGSGVYRIGSSVEFDWCAVRCIRTLRERGLKTIMVNYNPETVSTDYDEADRLYFETITLETILDIYELERSAGVIISVGGQTPNNIALPLHRQNVKILGTSPEMIDTAENRYKFSRMLDRIHVDQPLWKELTDMKDAHVFCDKVGYPVLVRPSYVLSGAAMNVVYSADDLDDYLSQAADVSRDHPVVITKYIEEAKEIEMDAIAKNGKLVMHYISEHVENAGVHSGDATLILPPQDLDPETISRIEVATQKIANALNVTGPLNIQFMAKNNEIKVIECNLRAARSYPFVSKVTGIDAITMATDVMLGFPVVPYPPHTMPENYVGVKVPQFSFSRLAGADPVLGVEMASTGEVACFGKDRYEAYLKALLSSGISIPKKNVLFSIGSYKEKLEMLPSIHNLHRLGYKLFATAGTSDFIQEHGIPVKYLEALVDEDVAGADRQKLEYSLNQHIANNMIDLYINLPSKNRFRRPASYMSKGYRSRRMAVDFAVPLITNVKCAKLFIEALVRKPNFAVDAVDCKSSHRTVTLPGLIALNAFVPGLAESNSQDIADATNAALRGGFTAVQLSSMGVTDAAKFRTSQTNANKSSSCDFALSVAATDSNVEELASAIDITAQALLVPYHSVSGTAINVASVAAHFESWPADRPLLTDAKKTELASILLLANLHNRSIHVTGVSTKEDIELIALVKARNLKVTCDVAIYSLFFTQDDFPGAVCLPTKVDVKALWQNMPIIDAFSIGSVPYEMARDLGRPYNAAAGFEEALPLLLSAVADGRLTIADIVARLADNPRTIFDLADQMDTYVDIEADRSAALSEQSQWSPLAHQILTGSVHRIVVRGETTYLDGKTVTGPGSAVDLGNFGVQTIPRKKSARFSVTGTRPSLQSTYSNSFNAPKSPKDSSFASQITKSPTLRGASEFPATNRLQPSPMSLSVPASQTLATSLSSFPVELSFARRHVLSVKQYTREDLHVLFSIANEMRVQVERNSAISLLEGHVLCTLFFEPSTRTSTSFEAAMLRLGGRVASVPVNQSSITKGETLSDTIRTVACYSDAIVLRHPDVGSSQLAAKFSPVPIVNAGDGTGEHPTQAMLDVYTIREELGTVNGLTVTMVGDLKNGRTVHSLVRVLSLYSVTFNFISPPSLGMPDSVKADLRRAGIPFNVSTDLESVIGKSDVLYVTRVQQERFASQAEYESVKDAYIVNNDLLAKARPHMAILHPLPRNAEIDPEVDFDSRAAYFRQMKYGLFVRMALLALLLPRREGL